MQTIHKLALVAILTVPVVIQADTALANDFYKSQYSASTTADFAGVADQAAKNAVDLGNAIETHNNLKKSQAAAENFEKNLPKTVSGPTTRKVREFRSTTAAATSRSRASLETIKRHVEQNRKAIENYHKQLRQDLNDQRTHFATVSEALTAEAPMKKAKSHKKATK